jgi:ABC-2 type transport system ATP-binding protein
VENVKKYYGETKALDGLSFTVNKGEILGLLGPNGAGKTTIVRVLATLLRPDSGKVKIDGIDVVSNPAEIREIIGLAGQYAAVDEILTGRQNLEIVGRLYHLPKTLIRRRISEVLKQMDLEGAADRAVKTYSGGMRRRLDLGASLMFTPKVLFLDEPTTGLDPKTRRDLWATIKKLVSEGVTLLLTTQYLEEADELADRIVVIDGGKVIAEGTSKELKRKLRGDVLEIELEKTSMLDPAKKLLESSLKTSVEIQKQLRQLRLPVSNGVADLETAIKLMKTNKLTVTHINLSQPSLDDVFLELTGKSGGNDV